MHTFPIQPLMEFTGLSGNQLEESVGFTVRGDRELDPWQADRLACRHGIHPALIWLDWWEWELPTCKVCGGVLEGKPRDATMCGRTCREKARRARRAAEKKAAADGTVRLRRDNRGTAEQAA